MKHTPGPWQVDHHHNIKAGGNLVAFPCFSAGLPQEANAQLIAAAPDLLEAVKNLLWYVTQLEPFVYGPDDTGEHEEVKAARLTIAKATGESQ